MTQIYPGECPTITITVNVDGEKHVFEHRRDAGYRRIMTDLASAGIPTAGRELKKSWGRTVGENDVFTTDTTLTLKAIPRKQRRQGTHGQDRQRRQRSSIWQ